MDLHLWAISQYISTTQMTYYGLRALVSEQGHFIRFNYIIKVGSDIGLHFLVVFKTVFSADFCQGFSAVLSDNLYTLFKMCLYDMYEVWYSHETQMKCEELRRRVTWQIH